MGSGSGDLPGQLIGGGHPMMLLLFFVVVDDDRASVSL